MLNRVLDKRLQNQARDSRPQRFRLHIPPHLQALAEAHEILESGDVMGNVVLVIC